MELQAAKVLRDSMQFTLVLLPGDSIPAIAPFDSTDAMAAAVLARSVWPKQAAELWGVRVRVSAGASPAVTVSRATYCPPELTPGSAPVRRIPELREERSMSVSGPPPAGSLVIAPRVRGTDAVPTIFEITVSPLGRVSRVTLVRSSGSDVFDSLTQHELAQQTYAPALLDGIPVPAVYRTDHGGPSAPLRLTSDDQVVVEAQVEQRPELLTTEPLRYPTALRQAGVEGRVMVRAIIDTTGRAEPSSVTIWQSPNPGFDQAARSFVLHARYRPARVHGRAVRVLVNVPIDFKIRRDEPRSTLQPSPSPP
jgi:TonB family protein